MNKFLAYVALLCVTSLILFSQNRESSISLALPKNGSVTEGKGLYRYQQWFVRLWNQKRARWHKDIQKDQKSLVFLGDSITQGWKDDFRGHFTQIKKANRGISGDTTRGMLYRLDNDVLSLNPSGVVLLMGTNDIEELSSNEDIVYNIDLIIKKLRSHSASIPILLCKVFPSHPNKDRPADVIKDLNLKLTSLAEKNHNITLVDTWSIFANENGNSKADIFPDRLHIKEKGYQMWAEALTPVLKEVGLMSNFGTGK